MKFPIFQFVPVASLILSLGSTEEHLAPSSFIRSSWAFSSPGCAITALSLSSCQLLQSLNDPHWIHSRSPGQDSTAGGSLLCWGETSHHLPGAAGTALPNGENVAQDAVGFLCPKYTLQALLQPAAHQDLVLSMFGNNFQGYLVCLQNEGKGLYDSGGDNMTLETSV